MKASERVFAYVGANTTAERGGKAKGISVFEIDPGSGAWELRFQTEDVNPGFLAFNKQKTALYCTHANHTEVSAYAMDANDGSLRLLNRRPLGGYNGTHLTVSHSGNYLLAAAASTGRISVFPIQKDNALGCLCDSVAPKGALGPLRRTEQPTSMPHQVLCDPEGRFVFSPDRGEERVHTFAFNEETGMLTQLAGMRTRAARTPRHMVFLKHTPKAYVLTEFSSGVICCDYQASSGTLKPFQIISALPESFVGLFNKGAEIAAHPSERFLYVSNRGHNSIAIFAIDPLNGALTAIGWQNTYGEIPRYFVIEESGRYLYVANEKSDAIVSFLIAENGSLRPTGQIIKTPTPTCILMTGAVANVDFQKAELKETVGEYRVFAYPERQKEESYAIV